MTGQAGDAAVLVEVVAVTAVGLVAKVAKTEEMAMTEEREAGLEHKMRILQ